MCEMEFSSADAGNHACVLKLTSARKHGLCPWGSPFMPPQAQATDQGFSYARILSLISLKWSKVIL